MTGVRQSGAPFFGALVATSEGAKTASGEATSYLRTKMEPRQLTRSDSNQSSQFATFTVMPLLTLRSPAAL
jgi:hypothetical protein